MKNLYKEYQKRKKNLKSILLLYNGKDYMAINEEAEFISKTFTTNLIIREYKFTIFNQEGFLEVLKQSKNVISILYFDFDIFGNAK